LAERALGEFALLGLWIADLAERAIKHRRPAAVLLTEPIETVGTRRTIVVPLAASNALVAIVFEIADRPKTTVCGRQALHLLA